MIAVIFEVQPYIDQKCAYLKLAEQLRPSLDQMDGFISIERFVSLTSPGKILSLSFWRDEEAVLRWRNDSEHRQVQAAGREFVFADYRLHVTHVLRDYGMRDRTEAPNDSRQFLHGALGDETWPEIATKSSAGASRTLSYNPQVGATTSEG